MNYPTIIDFKFDPHQEFEVNKIPNELYVLGDEQNVFVPCHAPFFVDSLKMRDIAGTPLIEDVDYRIFRMMGDLSALCAKECACLVEMLNPSIKKVYYEYHATGSSPLFDRSMIDLINSSANDQRLIKWKNIKHKPVVFNPIFHTHSLPYDMVVFKDTVSVINMWADNLDKLDTNIYGAALNTQTALVKNYFDRNSAYLQKALTTHAAAINEHGLDKADIGLDKVDNVGTTTIAEAIRGVSNKRLTPDALDEIIIRYGYNSDAFLHSNILPISFYGNTSFIPPAVGGSFEGLGSKAEAAAICMEKDGTISYLSNHYDGRSEGLYFSILAGYPNNLSMNYQSYRYTHPVLTANTSVPNAVAQGGGGEVLLVGSTRTKRWFIALTNGTLDPNYHVMCELDVSGFAQGYLVPDQLSTHLMGNYVIVIQSQVDPTGGENIGTSYKRFWRIPVSSFVSGSKLTPTAMKLSFTNQDGRSYTNSDYFVWCNIQRDASGKVTQLINKFNPPLNLTDITMTLYRTSSNITCAIPNRPDVWQMKFINNSYAAGSDPVAGVYQFSRAHELNYEFNPATGVMTQVAAKATPTIDTTNPTNIEKQINAAWGNNFITQMTAVFAQQCTMPMGDGNFLISSTNSSLRTPHVVYLLKTGAVSDYTALSRRFDNSNFPGVVLKSLTESISSPLPYSLNGCCVSYSATGEFFNAGGKLSNAPNYIFFREVAGEYSARDSFTNLDYPNIYSRPLSNNAYATGISNLQPRVGVTGDATFLSSSGLGFGETSMGIGVEGRIWSNPHSAWAGVKKTDRSIVLVRANNNVKIDNANWNFLPTAFVTYPDAIVKRIAAALIPAQYANTPDSYVAIADVTTIARGNIGTKPIIVQVVYGDVATQTRRHAVGTLQVTYDKSNNNNWVVTGFTVIGQGDVASMGRQSLLTPTSWDSGWSFRAQSENLIGLYYSGNTIRVTFNTFYITQQIGDTSNCGSVFTIDAATQAISNMANYNQNAGGGNNQVVVPKVGTVVKIGADMSGSTAQLVNANGTVYGLISCYPDPAWSLFFQSTIDVIFNGKKYTLNPGVVDLRSIKSNPGNTLFYLYASLVNGSPGYVISEVKTFDTPYNIWIGTVTTNATQITDITRFNALLMNGARVSEVKRGGAIPAVTGAITEEGQMAWIRTPEIIQG